ncbi:MAG: hypothetical protein KDC07_03515 [Chitinophagaceae bacterium]|nr:hypothetical protein [Chitinophagaceae bacterium]MCB9045743.1 hypothetical protein [Chitinophagales bacterium]
MKFIISTIFLCMVVTFPIQLSAQISTTKGEKYSLFTVVKTMKCNFMPPGTTGSAQTWDFSGLTPKVASDTTKAKYIERNSTMPFPSASIVQQVGKKYTFYEYTSNGVYELGILDSSSSTPDTLSYTDSKRIIMLPMTYTNRYIDTFNVTGTAITGGGNIIDTVESFGKLILPNDTFENVIRMYITEDISGTVSGVSGTIHKGSFLWYDLDHSSPLLRIDSTITMAGITNTTLEVAYLLDEDPVAIADVTITNLPVTATFAGDELVITGGTEKGHNYNVSLRNIYGQDVYCTIVTGGTKHLNTDKLPPGIYILAVDDKDEYGKIGILKLVKR